MNHTPYCIIDIVEINTEYPNTVDRRVGRNLGTPISIPFSIISTRFKDREVEGMRKHHGLWIAKVDKVKTDRNGRPFQIVSPIRKIADGDVISLTTRYPGIDTLLSNMFSDHPTEKTARFAPPYGVIKERLAQAIGTSEETCVAKAAEALVSGEFNANDLGEMISAPIGAKTSLVPGAKVDIGLTAMLDLYDTLSYNKVSVTAENLEQWAAHIPNWLRVSNMQNTHAGLLCVHVNMEKIADAKATYPKYALENIKRNRRVELTVTTVDGGKYDVIAYSNSEEYEQLLEKAGIKFLEGRPVPANTNWELDYAPKDVPHQIAYSDGFVSVRFANGMRGTYPLNDMLRKYEGQCTNATFSVGGDTVKNLCFIPAMKTA